MLAFDEACATSVGGGGVFVPDVHQGVRAECPPSFATNALCEMSACSWAAIKGRLPFMGCRSVSGYTCHQAGLVTP